MAFRSVVLGLALVILGSFSALGVAPLCEDGPVTAPPVPVIELPDSTLTLVETLPGNAEPGTPENHACGDKIRPGARVILNDSGRCTLNWIYADSAGALYAGTAGHCAPNLNPRKFTVAGIADIGDTAFTTGNSGVGNDFALIRIDPAYYALVDTTLCHWGGPQDVAHAATTDEAVFHYGWGQDFQNTPVTRARGGAVMSWGANSITFAGMVAGGDSGSPLMVLDPATGEGRAAGVITHTSYLNAPHTGPQYANRVDSGLARANAAQPGKGYHVVESAVLPDLTGLSVP